GRTDPTLIVISCWINEKSWRPAGPRAVPARSASHAREAGQLTGLPLSSRLLRAGDGPRPQRLRVPNRTIMPAHQFFGVRKIGGSHVGTIPIHFDAFTHADGNTTE